MPDLRLDLAAEHWKIRALFRSGGRESAIGTMLLAILGHGYDGKKVPIRKPSFGYQAKINEKGWIVTDVWKRDGNFYPATPICTAIYFRDAFRRLADEIKCTDAERLEFFAEINKWISVDERAKSIDVVTRATSAC